MSGKTGQTSGPHLHFEVRLDVDGFFATRNPELWLVPPQGYGVLAGRVMNTGGRRVEGQLVIVRPIGSEHYWRANSYHFGYIYPDDYYQENLVVSDLPAGKYEIAINYLSRIYRRRLKSTPAWSRISHSGAEAGLHLRHRPFPEAISTPLRPLDKQNICAKLVGEIKKQQKYQLIPFEHCDFLRYQIQSSMEPIPL